MTSFAERKARQLRDAANQARAKSDALKAQAEQAENAALEAEMAVEEWDEIAAGDLELAMRAPPMNFSFD